MYSITSAPCVTFLISLWTFSQAAPVPEEVTAKPGEDVTLQCRGLRNASISFIAWSRSDLVSGHYVFFFREKRPYKSNQLPSFHGRVELRDPEVKDGDASVILKNVTVNDSGTYQCLTGEEETRHRKRDTPELINIIHLKVENSGLTAGVTEDGGDGEQRERPGLFAALSVALVVVVVIILFSICKYKVLRENNSHQQ